MGRMGGRRVCAGVMALLLIWLTPIRVQAQRLVRVAFPIQAGLTEKDETGAYTGYSVDYLREIAQYTGWTYEFVEIGGDINTELTAALRMLKDGEVDLVGALDYSQELAALFDYPAYNYGTAHSVLAVRRDDLRLNENTYQSMKRLRIGVIRKASKRREELDAFCALNQLSPQITEYEDGDAMEAGLRAGEVDAITLVDLSVPKDMRVIARFASRPYYFATTKGNTEVVQGLNLALRRINEADPYFASTLYSQYFGQPKSGGNVVLSQEEQAVLAQRPTLRVLVAPNQAPMQYLDAQGQARGIICELLEMATAKVGLQLHFMPVSTRKEAQEKIKNGQADLLAAIPREDEIAGEYDVALTIPLLTAPVMLALSNQASLDNLGQEEAALQMGYEFLNAYQSPAFCLETLADCLAAVKRGQAGYTLGDIYTMQYSANQAAYRNLSFLPQPNWTLDLCAGVAKPVDPNLLSLLNKAIGSLAEQEVEAVVYRNTVSGRRVSLGAYIDANPGQALGLLGGLSAAAFAVLALYFRGKIKSARQRALDNERYAQLSELSNEFLYEFDVRAQRLLLSERSARRLGCPRQMEPRGDTGQPPALLALMAQTVEGVRELECVLPSGEKRWMRLLSKCLLDRELRPIYVVGKLTDIHEERQAKAQLEVEARQDGLTGLYNAATCRRLIGQALEKERGVLFILDIDNFKRINDQFGHYNGDLVLSAMGGALRASFRSQDILGRLGGDEFVAFLRREVSRQVVERKCDALRQAMAALPVDGQSGRITLSIGVAYSDADSGFESLYQRADQALYAVKRRGRNGYAIG